MLKFPGLLKKQYLVYSPLWKAYLNGTVVKQQLYQINSKLYSAYTLSQLIKQSNANQNKKKKQSKQMQLIEKFKMYYDRVHPNNQAKGCIDQPTQRINKYLSVYQLRNQDNSKYLQESSKIKESIFDSNHSQKSKQGENQNKRSIQQALSKQNKDVPQIINAFVKKSQNVGVDDIDLLLLKTIPMNIQILGRLLDCKLEWSTANLLTIRLFKQFIMIQLLKGKFDSIGVLKKYLNRFNNNQSDEKNIQERDIFLKSLYGLISSGKSMRDLNQKTKQLLFRKKFSKQVKNKGNFNFQTYLQLMIHQYLIYMDWLSFKSLFRPTSGSLVVNTNQFIQKIDYCKIDSLLKLRQKNSKKNSKQQSKLQSKQKQSNINKSSQQYDRLKQMNLRFNLSKLQIVTNFYNQITLIVGEGNKLREFKYELIGVEIVNNIRNKKLQIQKECSIIYSKIEGQHRNNLQQIGKAIQYVSNLTNMCSRQNKTPQTKFEISNSLIRKIAEKYLIQTTSTDVIVLNVQQKQRFLTILRSIPVCQDSLYKKFMEYKTRLLKHLKNDQKNDQNRVNEKEQVQRFLDINSLYQAKKLWKILKNQKIRMKIQQDNNQNLMQIIEHIFLLKQKIIESSKTSVNLNQQKNNSSSFSNNQVEFQNAEQNRKKRKTQAIFNFFS